ncbi:hypothetical protein [Pseudonocardia sp.]|uniref:hypothetical protein n=1 Tax=Pseudonocardia sp. TaxID=60912 RepID=UPI003D0D55C1
MRRSLIISLAAAAAVLAGCSDSPSTPAASSSTPQTTQQAAAATTSAPASVPTQTKSGTGNDVVTLDTPIKVGILKFDCSQCKGDVALKTDAAYDPDVLLLGKKAPYTGTHWLGMRGDTVTRMQIKASGPWTVTVGGLELARVVPGTAPVDGSGDDVLYLTKPAGAAQIVNKGSQYANFIVQVMTDGSSGPDLAVNEQGASYTGTVMFPAPGSENVQLVQIVSDGKWTITPK